MRKEPELQKPPVLQKTLKQSGVTEYFITVPALAEGNPSSLFERLDHHLKELGSPCILRMDIQGRINTMGTESLQQRYCYHCEDCALNHTRKHAQGRCPVGGIYVHAVGGGTVRPVWLGGQLMGNVFADRYVRYVSLDNLLPEAWLDRPKQVTQVFERMEDALHQAGMDFHQMVRTWLYLDDILSWYGDFNQARDAFFRSRKVYEGMIPTSTGIGGSNTAGTAIQASLLAAEPLSEKVTIQAVPSPLQCPAIDYGSSFSRAVEITSPEVRRLYIAGTASIDQQGPTRHVGDIDGQIAYTLNVVEAILQSRDLAWADVTRAVAYFKNLEDVPRFQNYCVKHQLENLPVGCTQNDVCRDDLLFELELDAVKTL